MLRAEHVMARLHRGRLLPHRISPENPVALEAAERLVDLYASHADGAGGSRADLEKNAGALEEELGPRLDPRRGFRVVRALGKLLEERCEWASPAGTDPYALRTRVFELAAALPELPSSEPDLLGSPTRGEVLERVGRETGLEDPAAFMYADRQGSQLLARFEAPSPQELLERYNVAQVQGVLYSARELVVDLGEEADARLVFHYVKLMDLIYRIETTGSGHRIHLDGPLSLFGGTRKYGLRLAKFLPGLLLAGPWRLSASVAWKGRDAALELDSESSGLKSHYVGPREHRERAGEEGGEVAAAFARAWERARDTGGWRLAEGPGILAIPGSKAALVPDFTLVSGETGGQAHLEILGFWSEKRLIERVALIRAAAARGHRVLVAASENLGASPEALGEAAGSGVIPFKGRLEVKVVLRALEEDRLSN